MDIQTRHPLAKISVFGITQLKAHNPYMIAWWSAVFPGFGHYLLNQYTRATMLTLAEVSLNTMAHINEAMIYSFCGNFERATLVLEPKWALGYLTIYLIAISDSFRTALYQNKLYHLALHEHRQTPIVKIFPTEIQYIEIKSPILGALYSFFFPGLGQLYNHRYGLAFYAMLWWWIYMSLSKVHHAFIILAHGHLQDSISLLVPHWLLFMPSVMGGSIYHAYRTAIEHNHLFRIEQRRYLTKRYQNVKLQIFP